MIFSSCYAFGSRVGCFEGNVISIMSCKVLLGYNKSAKNTDFASEKSKAASAWSHLNQTVNWLQNILPFETSEKWNRTVKII